MPASHHSVFYRPDALPATQPTASKHWRQNVKAPLSFNRMDHPLKGIEAATGKFVGCVFKYAVLDIKPTYSH